LRIFVRYFARVRELVDIESENIEILPKATLGGLVKHIGEKYSIDMGELPLFFSVNHEYSDMGKVLCEGDEVAIMYPPSGG